MTCNEAAEFASALCDGETIPPAAAEHIGTCEVCQARMRDYLTMGVEMRRLASLEAVATVPTRVEFKPQSTLQKWWQKGWGTMRIPRLAFAVLLIGIIALGSTLVVVKVRAHDTGTVVLLTVSADGIKPLECPLSTVDKKDATCGFLGGAGTKTLGYKIDLLERDGDRVELGIRSRLWVNTPNSRTDYTLDQVDKEPEQRFWFAPGEALSVDISGFGRATIKGVWLDHMPAFPAISMRAMDPGPDELRVVSPLLLRENDVVGDMEGGSATLDTRGGAVWIHYANQGSYLLSQVPTVGGIQAQVNLNRVTFTEDDHHYTFITGTPITRSKELWVLHLPNLDPTGKGMSFISTQALVETAPGKWESPLMPK